MHQWIEFKFSGRFALLTLFGLAIVHDLEIRDEEGVQAQAQAQAMSTRQSWSCLVLGIGLGSQQKTSNKMRGGGRL